MGIRNSGIRPPATPDVVKEAEARGEAPAQATPGGKRERIDYGTPPVVAYNTGDTVTPGTRGGNSRMNTDPVALAVKNTKHGETTTLDLSNHTEEQRKGVISLIRRAAMFHKVSLKLGRVTAEGKLSFTTGEHKPRKRKNAEQAPQAAE